MKINYRRRVNWEKYLGLFWRQGETIKTRSRLRFHWPVTVEIYYVEYPRLAVPPRPVIEHASAQTPKDWQPGEQSDNLNTRS
jgi:hypothetical protein